MPEDVELVGVEIQHLRGFTAASLLLSDRMLLVGPNNSGKSSICHLLDFAFNGDRAAVLGDRDLSEREQHSLLPSRDSRGRARRLTLLIRVLDRRRYRRFSCDSQGIARLRITVRGSTCVLTVSPPTRRTQSTEPAAKALLEELRDAYQFRWLPAGLGNGGASLGDRLREEIRDEWRRLAEVIPQSGSPRQYRDMKSLRDRAVALAEKQGKEFAQALDLGPARGMLKGLKIEPAIEVADVADWLAGTTSGRMTTGDHDAWGVPPEELGSGMQALLYLALFRRRRAGKQHLLLAIEEPESHLHPAMQRVLARELLQDGGAPVTMLISTHAAEFVSEARYEQVVLVKEHRYFVPSDTSEARRNEINTALMDGRAAEAFFADSVLLVEGPGDVKFFDGLRRRLVDELGLYAAERIFVLDVGSNTQFGPWLRLFRSYGDEALRPIEWLSLCDGDSTGPIQDAIAASGQSVSLEIRSMLSAFGSLAWDSPARVGAAAGVNRAFADAGHRAVILPIDLEWELAHIYSTRTRHLFVEMLGDFPDPVATEQVARKMGSKVTSGKASSGGRKEPWMRARLAATAGWSELTPRFQDVLVEWLGPAVGDRAQARTELSRLQAR